MLAPHPDRKWDGSGWFSIISIFIKHPFKHSLAHRILRAVMLTQKKLSIEQVKEVKHCRIGLAYTFCTTYLHIVGIPNSAIELHAANFHIASVSNSAASLYLANLDVVFVSDCAAINAANLHVRSIPNNVIAVEATNLHIGWIAYSTVRFYLSNGYVVLISACLS